jgi:hypothetical protein
MDETTILDLASLIDEVECYLAAVDLFRAERCEPTWLPELAPCQTADGCAPNRGEHAASARATHE